MVAFMVVGDGLALEIINVLQRNLSFRESEIPNTYFLMAFLVQTAFYVVAGQSCVRYSEISNALRYPYFQKIGS